MRKSSELTFKGPEVCRDSGGAETVIQNGVYNGIIALNVIVDGEREVRHSHAMVSVDDWMDARKAGQALERFVKTLHEIFSAEVMLSIACKTGGMVVIPFRWQKL